MSKTLLDQKLPEFLQSDDVTSNFTTTHKTQNRTVQNRLTTAKKEGLEEFPSRSDDVIM